MRHHILVKWKKDRPAPPLEPINALFQKGLQIPGIHSVSLHPNVIDRENRYDLLILLCMDREAERVRSVRHASRVEGHLLGLY